MWFVGLRGRRGQGAGRKNHKSREILYKKVKKVCKKNNKVCGAGFVEIIFTRKKERKREGGTLLPIMCYTFVFSDNR